MHFGLRLIRKEIKKKTFLIHGAYHSRVFETETDSNDGRERCVCGGIKGGGWAGERVKKGRTDKVGLVLSSCHTGDR